MKKSQLRQFRRIRMMGWIGLLLIGLQAQSSLAAVQHIMSTFSDAFSGYAYHLWIETDSRNQISKLWISQEPTLASKSATNVWNERAVPKGDYTISEVKDSVDLYRYVVAVIDLRADSGFSASQGGRVQMDVLENYKRVSDMYDSLYFWVRKDGDTWRVYAINDRGKPGAAPIQSLYFYANRSGKSMVGVAKVSGYAEAVTNGRKGAPVFTLNLLKFEN